MWVVPVSCFALPRVRGILRVMSVQADFLIIGGGVAGVSAAARLAPLGRLVLVEAESALAYHASGRSAAMFLKAYGRDAVRALNEASEDHHRTADGGVLSPRPMMLIARPQDAALFDSECKRGGLTPVSISDARARMPILNPQTIAQAAIRADACDLDTHLLIQNFARTARSHGADFRQSANVTDIAYTNGHWRVQAGDDTITATTLINAAGAWADQIAQMAGIAPIGITPHRRSMARIPAPGGHDITNWPFVEAVAERWYAKPDAGKLIVSPSEEDPMPPHDAFADDMVLAEGLARYADMVTEPVTRVEHSWAGLRSFAPDRSLVIGRDVSHPEFVWCAGQGGYGFQTAPAASQLLSEVISGAPPHLPASIVQALSPARFT